MIRLFLLGFLAGPAFYAALWGFLALANVLEN